MTDNSNIDVIQLNLNKAHNAGIDLLGKINKSKCFLALIQEPYCYKGTLAAIPGRSDAIPSTNTGGPRAAIFADKRLKVRELTNLCTKDLAAGVGIWELTIPRFELLHQRQLVTLPPVALLPNGRFPGGKAGA